MFRRCHAQVNRGRIGGEKAMNRAIRLKAVNMAKARPKASEILKRVREICLSLPETMEKEAWSAPPFRVKKKMFAMFVNNHHGDEKLLIKDPSAGSASASTSTPTGMKSGSSWWTHGEPRRRQRFSRD